MVSCLMNGGIRALPADLCPSCGLVGAVLYPALTDRLFGAPGLLNIRRCGSRACGAVWLDPQPIDDDVPKLYERYYTHESGDDVDPNLGSGSRRQARRAILREVFGYTQHYPSEPLSLSAYVYSRSALQRDRAGRYVLWLKAVPDGRLLDFGCGSGNFMRRMSRLGWNVVGYEPDPKAAATAQATLGLPVVSGDSADGACHGDPFDAIVLNHVVEHLPRPEETLRDLAKALKPRGQLVVVTPNFDSLGRVYFGSNWRGLEPPRHLRIYRSRSLRACAVAGGYEIDRIFSVAASAPWMWLQGLALKGGGHDIALKQQRMPTRLGWATARGFEAVEQIALTVGSFGEEIVVSGRRCS